MIPMMIYQVVHGQYVSAIVIIIGLILMTIIRRFVEPAILGKSLKMHPIVTLIAMAAGVYIWGAAGFLLGPVLAIIIIQAIKVFDIDKMAGKYFSGILDRLMVSKDEKDKKAAKEAVKEELESEEELEAEEKLEAKEKLEAEGGSKRK